MADIWSPGHTQTSSDSVEGIGGEGRTKGLDTVQEEGEKEETGGGGAG